MKIASSEARREAVLKYDERIKQTGTSEVPFGLNGKPYGSSLGDGNTVMTEPANDHAEPLSAALTRVSAERDHQAWLAYRARAVAADRKRELDEIRRVLGGAERERALASVMRMATAAKAWAEAMRGTRPVADTVDSLIQVAESMHTDASREPAYRGILAGLAPTDEQVEAEAKRLSAFLSTVEWNATGTMEGWRETWRAVARDVLARRGAK